MDFLWTMKDRTVSGRRVRSSGWPGACLGACLGAAAAALVLCAASAAQAQISPFRGYSGPALSKSDIEAGTQAAGRLLGATPRPVGAVEDWASPDSGNTGTLTIERAYHRQGHDCRAIRSRVTYKAGRQRSYVLNACRVSGQWKLWD